jgi:hypothetical protein
LISLATEFPFRTNKSTGSISFGLELRQLATFGGCSDNKTRSRHNVRPAEERVSAVAFFPARRAANCSGLHVRLEIRREVCG